MKPILFNTEMVRAILKGQKTQTRRIIAQRRYGNTYHPSPYSSYKGMSLNMATFEESGYDTLYYFTRPYSIGDILYVRETWCQVNLFPDAMGKQYIYRASDEPVLPPGAVAVIPWRPSIHMPKEAARIFLRVTDVKVERLKDITDEGAKAEGANMGAGVDEKMRRSAISRFADIWNKTVSHTCEGWAFNPWVWVISFEKISREEAMK